MRPDERTLTDEEQAALDTIEAMLARPLAAEYDTTSVAGLATLLRQGAPQADDAFRARLRERVVAEAARRPVDTRRFTRRRVLAAGLAAAGLGGAALAVPGARAALAGLLGFSSPPPTPLPIAVERTTPLPLRVDGGRRNWTGADDAQREFFMRTIAREQRWALFARFPAPEPSPGSVVVVPDNRPLPVPGYLPVGFRWQGIAVSDGGPPNAIPFDYRGQGGGGSTGGGGSGLPWERPLRYDRRIGVYLIGGDPADRLLALQQLKPETPGEVVVSVFQMEVPPQPPPPMPPGAYASPGFYGERTVLGVLVEPARDHVGLTVQAGPGAVQPTTVGGAPAWWFAGVWTADGRWSADDTWRSVVWARDGYVYCLTGQSLDLAELLRVAESLPPAP